MKLYSMPGACSTADHIALQWTGEAFDFQTVSHDQLGSPEILKLNPNKQIPILVDGDFVLTQNVAIMNYIAESFPKAHLEGDGSKRQKAETLRWLAFMNADVHPAFALIFHAKNISNDPKIQETFENQGRKQLRELYAIADKQLNGKEWIAGFRSVADPYLFITLKWAQSIKLDISDFSNLERFLHKMEKDPGVIAVFKAEGLS
ncbi:MAG: glutathione S-transferase N-terminal domain-containing protein [Commensalibacter sp.]|nr:glutathione S-transferase N-terminal domain-containing protein [Commensalibacter sp.]